MSEVSPEPVGALRAAFASLRPLHWTKNLLVFAPMLLSHQVSASEITHVVLAFGAFCMSASGTYLINDVRDREHDRRHPVKALRMVAAGRISVHLALVAALSMMVCSVAIAAALSTSLLLWLIAYDALSLAYSMGLKRRVFLDVLTLSVLYSIRVLAGGAAANVEVSDWLLALSGFLFMSLALLKRYADLRLLLVRGQEGAPGRDYTTADVDLLRSMGVASGYLSVLVLALYITSPHVVTLYHAPRVLWLICPLFLYWVAHMWFLAHRGKIQDDPIVIAARDATSYILGLMIAIILMIAV